ncbi:MAG: MucR family transcriptional regulator [Candidatus Firestonebacteria bacterium]|nr:MucR family transcriptional regulator [Candidatus Firestonebacteria bacterium]
MKKKQKEIQIVDDRIQCQVCGKWYEQITWSHLYKWHNMSTDDYREKYNIKTFCSLMVRQKHIENSNNPVFLEKQRKAYIELWQNPKMRALFIKVTKERWEKNTKYRKKMLKQLKQNRENPDFLLRKKKYMKEKWENPEYRAKMQELSKRVGNDPKIKEIRRKTFKKTWKNPEFRERRVEAGKKIMKDPKYRAKILEKNRLKWKDPEFRLKMEKMWKDTKFLAKIRKRNKAMWKNPEFRAKALKNLEIGREKRHLKTKKLN